jgi:prepilin-type N-terminal cleavage/methylation domain-containing protein
MKMKRKKTSGFTLIELLVVISIIGILMGIVGPKVFDLLSGSKVTKTQSVFRAWVTQLYQYKEFYRYFPPFLLEEDEGVSVSLEEEENHEAFIAALRGMKWNPSSLSWESLDGELKDQNKKGREFHSFGEDEFGYVDPDGDEQNNGKFLSDAWGNPKIRILVDQDGDGLIKLSDQDLSDIVSALKVDYDAQVVDAARDKLQVIRDKVGIFVLFDDSGGWDTESAFSWDVAKFLQAD